MSWVSHAIESYSPADGSAKLFSGGEDWSQFPTENLLYLLHDVRDVPPYLVGQFPDLVQSTLPPCTLKDEMVQMLAESISDSRDQLERTIEGISAILVGYLTSKCVAGLGPLAAITTTYRMTQKAPPTKHSYYVENITQPLENFFKSSKVTLLESDRSDLQLNVLAAVTDEYTERGSQLLNNLRKTESFLKTMAGAAKKKAAEGESSKGQAMSDTEKIELQLFLDVKRFGELLFEKFGVRVESFEPYKKLRQSVSEHEKLVSFASSSANIGK